MVMYDHLDQLCVVVKVPGANYEFAYNIPYSEKLSREKTFVNFEVYWLFA